MGEDLQYAVEVIALLAKHELQAVLDGALSRKHDDHSEPLTSRPLQHQRRLSAEQVKEVANEYVAGATVHELARTFQVHRTTVLAHLQRQNVDRRPCVRRMTDADVAAAARLYADGQSLKDTATRFGVHSETLRREFQKVGVAIRPRPGRSKYNHLDC